MKHWKSLILTRCLAAIAALSASFAAHGTTLQDLVRIKGHEPVMLQGMGIVIGLPGTGDSGRDARAAARPYAQLLKELGDPVGSVDELTKADTFAIVMVSMEVPATGARDGDRLDVHVETLFNAKSIEGGRLVVSPLWLPLPGQREKPPVALASGSIVVQTENRRSGLIRGGGQLVRDFPTAVVSPSGAMTLILKEQYAGYPIAAAVADVVNTDPSLSVYSDIASVVDAQTIRVLLPPVERADPAGFIATMMTLQIDPSLIRTEARIVINEKKGIIAVTGSVQIGPVAVNAAGLTITSITPAPEPTPDNPAVTTTQWAGLDTTSQSSRASTRLVDLLRALEQLKVPTRDQIAIIYELKKTGALHAEIVRE
jgi:flagellar P-ring protein precursor FlgI